MPNDLTSFYPEGKKYLIVVAAKQRIKQALSKFPSHSERAEQLTNLFTPFIGKN